MKSFFRNQLNNILRKKGEKAGIVPVANLKNENQRLAELNRLGIIEKEINPFAIFFQIFSLDKKQSILKLNTQELKMYIFQEGDRL